MNTTSPLSVMPVASFQAGKGFYAEARYNYEDLNTLSFYMGRTFSKESNFSYSISPIAGVVVGQFNGGSVGANISLGYKNFYLYSQPQYTFAVENSINNFIYSWTDITYSPLNWLSVGVSIQHTKPKEDKGFLENGFVIETAYKKFTFPIYIFNPQSKSRSFVFGASFEVNFRKRKTENKESDPLKDYYPVNIIANSAVENKTVPSETITKPATETIVKVRRVNVIVRDKTDVNKDKTEVNNLQRGNNTKSAQLSKPEVKSVTPVSKSEVKIASGVINKTDGDKIQPQNANIAASRNLINPIGAQKNNTEIYYALLLGPFKGKEEAQSIKSRLTAIFNRDIILYSDEKQFKLRIAGFKNQKDAEIFSLNASNEGSNTGSEIISYKLQNIDAIPLSDSSKKFEATKL